MSSITVPASTDTEQSFDGVMSPSFQGLLWTNWLTAINDNVFRWFVIGVGKTFVSPSEHGNILMFGTLCFVLPYMLFASPAGWLADRFRKRDVIIGCKVAEIVVMTLGVVALLMDSIYLLMGAVVLMGTQSALFAPAKIGTIPELLSERDISKGNGIFNLATLSAVIIGMSLGGWLADIAGHHGQKKIWLTAMVLIGIATVGTVISLIIRPQKIANATAKFPVNFLGETWRNIVDLYSHRKLFTVTVGITFFWAIASLAQLNIDAFADESGSIFESEKTPLLVSLILGVGVGSVIAGFASGSRIELGLVPWGAFGMVAFFAMLYFSPANFITGDYTDWKQWVPCLLLGGLGISAGFFDVPMASYLQHKSPVESRGAILSAANCLMFGGIALLSVLLMVLRTPTYPTDSATADSVPPALESAVDRQTIDSAVAALKSDWESRPAVPANAEDREEQLEPLAGKYLPAKLVGTPAQWPAVRQLVFADAKERMKRDAAVNALDYSKLYDGNVAEQRTLKTVLQRASDLPLLSSRQLFLLMGLMTMPVFLYSSWRLAKYAMRLLWLGMLKLVYRVRINGLENLPQDRGSVLIANHSTWLDGVIFLTAIPPTLRVLAWSGNFGNWVMKKWAKFCGIILISGGPKAIRKSFSECRDAIDDGEMLGVFPEGGFSRSMQVRTFKPGLMKILGDRQPPIIPVYIDELWGSIFSYYDGKFITKIPRSFRRPISVTVGEADRTSAAIHARNPQRRPASECDGASQLCRAVPIARPHAWCRRASDRSSAARSAIHLAAMRKGARS